MTFSIIGIELLYLYVRESMIYILDFLYPWTMYFVTLSVCLSQVLRLCESKGFTPCGYAVFCQHARSNRVGFDAWQMLLRDAGMLPLTSYYPQVVFLVVQLPNVQEINQPHDTLFLDRPNIFELFKLPTFEGSGPNKGLPYKSKKNKREESLRISLGILVLNLLLEWSLLIYSIGFWGLKECGLWECYQIGRATIEWYYQWKKKVGLSNC